ncbi:Uncharacterized protein TCM_005827 isoform 2, partial [Theobroma cacao]
GYQGRSSKIWSSTGKSFQGSIIFLAFFSDLDCRHKSIDAAINHYGIISKLRYSPRTIL